MANVVKIEKQGAAAFLVLDRPEAKNSLDEVMAEQLSKATALLKEDMSVRAVVLRAEGPIFMPGGDIHYFHRAMSELSSGMPAIFAHVNATIDNLQSMGKPVLASVQGAAAGFGVSLMLACDLVVAADNTKFNLAYTKLGTNPDGGATYFLPRLVGPKKAMEWILLSEAISVREAEMQGLVNWVVPEPELRAVTVRLAERLATGPTKAYAATKRLLAETWHHDLKTQLAQEAQLFAENIRTADFREGVKAFVGKVSPVFKGE